MPARPATTSSTSRTFQIVLAAVALIALVFGVIAVNTAGDTHDHAGSDHASLTAAPVANFAAGNTAVESRGLSAATITTTTAEGGQQCGQSCELGCTFAGVACALGFTALMTGGQAQGQSPANQATLPRSWAQPVLQPVHTVPAAPSLIALSISRT